ncbi:MAG: hypothetical protein WAM82_00650 [Thermoanaerobaculia bacterium]
MSGEPYTPPVDPGGGARNAAQQGSTAASTLGFVALVVSEAGDKVAAALGLGAHSPQVLTAGISFAGLGSSSLFTVGLTLVALGIILNLISLGLKSRQPPERAAGPKDPAAPSTHHS